MMRLIWNKKDVNQRACMSEVGTSFDLSSIEEVIKGQI